MGTSWYYSIVAKIATSIERGDTVTNGKLLKQIAKSKHFTLQRLAEAIGVSRQGLSNKIENRSEFKASEVSKLSDLLGLSAKQKQDIFFAI